MYKITSDEIRNIFLEYFQSKDHLKISGSSVIPKNDPTLLYINSGMAPLKKYFTGEEVPPDKKLCNIQPCIRTIDIDEIGDRHHLTSFEMLGSWSINDYFKKDAIPIAFKLLTEYLKIPKEKLYATVFMGSDEVGLGMDQESVDIWKSVGLPEDHIVPQPFEDNFWGPTAETGPCGPCTEVFYDTGDQYGDPYVPGGEFDTKHRYIEIWNAGVFMQFNKNEKGEYEKLQFNSVDTGAGLERLTMTLNKLTSVYEIDSLKPIVDIITEEFQKAGISTDDKEEDIHIMTDHLRTVTILLAAGVKPTNTGRGYIPRRLIRKCLTIVQKYGIKDFPYKRVLDRVIEHYSKYYDHFESNRQNIYNVFNSEVDSYSVILTEGIKRVEKICQKTDKVVSGKDAFILVTTYGLPFALVKEYIEGHGKTVDEADYQKEVEHHKEVSRQASESNDNNASGNKQYLKELEEKLEDVAPTKFVGYEKLSCQAECLCIQVNKEDKETISEGESGAVVFSECCFYAESGGQIADTGIIKGADFTAKVNDVKKVKDKFVHFITVEAGSLSCKEYVEMTVDAERRHNIEANHTSVHLLQNALRELLGTEVKQAGSLVTEDRLRFDFYYDNKISDEELNHIELKVNKLIQADYERKVTETTYEEAVKDGVLAFFDNKYGDTVRMVDFGGVSKELCGGTHIQSTGKIGMFKIVSEESTGRGVRRITAVTGIKAVQLVQEQLTVLKEVSRKLKVTPDCILDKIENMQFKKQNVKEEKLVTISKDEIEKLVKKNEAGIAYITYEAEAFSNELRDEAVRVADVISGVTCFYATVDGKVRMVVSVAKQYQKEKKASDILKKAVTYVNGNGGGSSHLAMGGGDNIEGIAKMVSEFGTLF